MHQSHVGRELDQGEKPLITAVSGCVFAAFVVSLSAGMLFLNALLCLTIYSAFPKPQGNEDMTARMGQMFFFLAPVILLIIEWNLIDRVRRLFQQRAN